MSSNKINVPFEKKLKVVKTCLAGQQPLRTIAQKYRIPLTTLWYWLQAYKKAGEHGLRTPVIRKPGIQERIRLEVIRIKERHPALGVKQAHSLLEKDRIKISEGSIWNIWKSYGLTKRALREPLLPFCKPTPELEACISKATQLIHDGKFGEAAALLNDMPSLPDILEIAIIKKVPKHLLSPRRQLDRLYLDFGTLPFPEYRKKAHRIGKTLEHLGYIHSSTTAYFLELAALTWMVKPVEAHRALHSLRIQLMHTNDAKLWFLYYYHKAYAHLAMLEIEEARAAIKTCRRLAYYLNFNKYWQDLGILLAGIQDYKGTCACYDRALRDEKDMHVVQRIRGFVAIAKCIAGEYRECMRLLNKVFEDIQLLGFSSAYSITKAYVSLGQGHIAEASTLFLEALKATSKGELYNQLYGTSVGLASIAIAQNNKPQAQHHLKKYLPLMKKNKLQREALQLEHLSQTNAPISEELCRLPVFRLYSLLAHAKQTLKPRDYNMAYRFAQKKGIMGIFHRLVLFYPESVLKLLEKGKQTGLPRALLGLPVFNPSVPVYHIRFLGDVNISKDQKTLKRRCSPKENSFMIHLALRAGEPGKSIRVDELSNNFWIDSAQPSVRLSHLLTDLKKKLVIPAHLLRVSTSYGEYRLVNSGLYLTTDYNEFVTLLTQAQTLEHAGEWQYAKRDYLRAFALIRGAPFAKMYDEWSETMRGVILTKLEQAAKSYAQSCLKHNDARAAQTIIEKISRLLPQSDELRKLLNAKLSK